MNISNDDEQLKTLAENSIGLFELFYVKNDGQEFLYDLHICLQVAGKLVGRERAGFPNCHID